MERKLKWAKGTQRKKLVNGVGLQANKPKDKGYGNWAKEAQRIQQKPMRMKEVGKNEIGQGCPKNETGRRGPKNEKG